jgi:hypothetical protein
VTIVEWVTLLLVPVIITVYVPSGVVPLVVTFIVDEPDPPAIGFILKVAVTPLGKAPVLNATSSANPPDAVTLTL